MSLFKAYNRGLTVNRSDIFLLHLLACFYRRLILFMRSFELTYRCGRGLAVPKFMLYVDLQLVVYFELQHCPARRFRRPGQDDVLGEALEKCGN